MAGAGGSRMFYVGVRVPPLAVLMIGLLVGCRSVQRDTRVAFALNRTDRSLLPKIDRKGRLDVCVGMVEGPFDTARRDLYERSIENAVGEWNALLVGMRDPVWRRAVVMTDIVFEVGSCEGYDLNVNVWTTVERWEATFPELASHVDMPTFTINVDPRWDTPRYHDYLVRHEYGHMLGMGDTYTTEGVLEPVGQPTSIYNQMLPILTDDDRAGVRAAWRYARTGYLSCGPGYHIGYATENAFRYLFCVPDAT